MIKIGLIGCGAIGSVLAQTIERRFHRFAYLAYVSDCNPEQIHKLRRKVKSRTFRSVSANELIRNSNLIIEAASQEAARLFIPEALHYHKDILVLSVGGVFRIPNIQKLVARSRGHVYIPSGAIAGIDSVLAAKVLGLRRVRITTRKPLKSLLDSPYLSQKKFKVRKICKPTLIFEGDASQAIRYFPQNINVAATLSLAGLGSKKTRVRIFASPTYRHNIHEIELIGRFGRMVSTVTNIPSKENPKTSVLAIGSAIAALEKIFQQIKVGT